MKKYLCGVTFQYELGHALDIDNFIYSSIEELKSTHPCWEECGIVEIDVESDNYDNLDRNIPHTWIVEENMELMFANAKSSKELEKTFKTDLKDKKEFGQ